MPPTLLDTFRVLSSFDPRAQFPGASLLGAPWEDYVEWVIDEGLAPLAAYNLQYAIPAAGAPDRVKERLLAVYQGTLNDNVMKLVNFKRAIGALEGRRVVLLGSASFAEALYPHLAFRPVEELHLWVPPGDVDGLAGYLRESEFKPLPDRAGEQGARLVLSDTRTDVLVHDRLFGGTAEDSALGARLHPLRIYGGSVFRLSLEDALLAACLEHARNGYAVPLIAFVDLRELVRGAPDLSGPWSRPPDAGAVLARAKESRLERALHTSLSIVEQLFPEMAPIVAPFKPSLRAATRALLDRWVVKPRTQLGQRTTLRGMERIRRLLTGGRA